MISAQPGLTLEREARLSSEPMYSDDGFAFDLTFWHLVRTVLTSASRSSWHQLRIRFDIEFVLITLASASHSSGHRLRIRVRFDIGFALIMTSASHYLDIGFACIGFACTLTSASHWCCNRLRIHLNIGFAASWHRLRISCAMGFWMHTSKQILIQGYVCG